MSNEAGESEYTYEITVQYPPIFENSIANATTINVNASTNFSIECQVDGFPTPEVRSMHCLEVNPIKKETLTNDFHFKDSMDTQWRSDFER